jgi:hypothetical protein
LSPDTVEDHREAIGQRTVIVEPAAGPSTDGGYGFEVIAQLTFGARRVSSRDGRRVLGPQI